MDYQPQTLSTDEMNRQLATLLAEMKAMGEQVDAIADNLEADYINTLEAIASAKRSIDAEYASLDAAEAETEAALDEIILTESAALAEE